MSLLDIELTITLGHLAQPYLVIVGLQLLAVTHAYLYGSGKESFFNAYLAATVLGTVAAYLVLVFGPL